jgi:hypothetical protein
MTRIWPTADNVITAQMPHKKQLQRTVIRRLGEGANAPFHCALVPRFTRQRAAAELPVMR